MANRPLKSNLPADLPDNWTNGNIVAPEGSSVGLSNQHGYNYLMQQVNAAQTAANTINAAFDGLASSNQLPSQNKLVYTLGYSKSGTTHKLTGLSGVSGTVSAVFTATAGFSAGDTFTVEGTPYTIQLSNGETAEDNLFVSGATVSVIIDTEAQKINFKAAGGGMKFNPAYLQSTMFVYTEDKSGGDTVGGVVDNNFYYATGAKIKKVDLETSEFSEIFSLTNETPICFSKDSKYLYSVDYRNYVIKKYSISGDLISQKGLSDVVKGVGATRYASNDKGICLEGVSLDDKRALLVFDENLNYVSQNTNITIEETSTTSTISGGITEDYYCFFTGVGSSQNYTVTVYGINIQAGTYEKIVLNQKFDSRPNTNCVLYDGTAVYVSGRIYGSNGMERVIAVFNKSGDLVAKRTSSSEDFSKIFWYNNGVLYLGPKVFSDGPVSSYAREVYTINHSGNSNSKSTTITLDDNQSSLVLNKNGNIFVYTVDSTYNRLVFHLITNRYFKDFKVLLSQ